MLGIAMPEGSCPTPYLFQQDKSACSLLCDITVNICVNWVAMQLEWKILGRINP